MEYNVIEIEFISPGFKTKFKQLVGDQPGPFFEKIFPWPATKLHGAVLRAIDEHIWSEEIWGIPQGSLPSRVVDRYENQNSISYTYRTMYGPVSYNFLKHFAFIFPVRQIIFSHGNIGKHVCIRNKSINGSWIFGCPHSFCEKHFLPKQFTLDWRHLPHPIYEAHQTVNLIIRSQKNPNFLMSEEYGKIYHHIVSSNTFFSIYDSPAIAKAKKYLEAQLKLINNNYLQLLQLLDLDGPPPDISATKTLESCALFAEERYTQPDNKAYLSKPLRVIR